jgi:hypothetical protein
MNSRVVGLVGRGARALVLEVERAPVLGGEPNRSAMPQASLSPQGSRWVECEAKFRLDF